MLYAHAIYHSKAMLRGTEADGSLSMEQKIYLQKLRDVAKSSSLGAVTRSLAYHDLPAYFAPVWGIGKDRGSALEDQWAANAERASSLLDGGWRFGGDENLGVVTLAQWGRQARAGEMPAVLFTSGTEESGRPMIYGSSRVADWNWNAIRGINDAGCSCLVRNHTVRVVTGARLSASFPIVSPAARPSANPDYLYRVEHQLDGGYYDNYGMVALNRWLQDGLDKLHTGNELPKNLKKILVIQIRYKNEPSKDEVKAGGFFYQATAPLTALYNARVAGQRLRVDEQFDIFCNYWKARGVEISNAVFEFDGRKLGTPLSWHLTARQREDMSDYGSCIIREFEDYQKGLAGLENVDPSEKKLKLESLKAQYPLGANAYLVKDFIHPDKP